MLHPVMHTIDALPDVLNFAETVPDIPDNEGDEEFDDNISSSDSSNSDDDDINLDEACTTNEDI